MVEEKKILLANIGNRNLLYKGVKIPDLSMEETGGRNFKNFTEWLSQNLEREQFHIDLNILNTLLDSRPKAFDQVILFSSNQINQGRQDQDTLYAGIILKKLIEEKYTIPVELQELRCKITDNGQLIRTYRGKLKEIIGRFGNRKFVICDAGGTAQQKSSLKIIAEYLFDPADFEVIYIAQGKNFQSILESVDSVEYRKIINLEQISALLAKGNYNGAAEIYGMNTKSASLVSRLLLFAHYRKEHEKALALAYAKPNNYKQSEYENLHFLADYAQQKPLGKYEDFKKLMTREQFFDLCEVLSIASFYYSIQDFTRAVLFYCIFMERYLVAVFTQRLGYNLEKEYETSSAQMVLDARNNPQITQFFGSDSIQRGIPLQLCMAESLTDPLHQQMLASLKKCNRWFINPKNSEVGLDKLRNDYAHRGLGISEGKLARYVPDFDDIKTKWELWAGLPSTNVFVQLNSEIGRLL